MIQIKKAKPFLKWAGGKRALIPSLSKLIPQDFNRYFEPFLGGGALFFELNPSRSILSDVNVELINAYLQIKNNPNDVIRKLKKIRHCKEEYYKIRSQRPKSVVSRAARFIYLNRTCWNGLYRENKNGEFNVPMGRYINPLICDSEGLMQASKSLKNAQINSCDFEDILAKAQKKDLIYLDPPYVTGHKNNGFINYNNKIFKWEDQKRLASVAMDLKKKGCYVIISNASHESIDQLYNQFFSIEVSRLSLLAASSKKRGNVEEKIFTSFKN